MSSIVLEQARRGWRWTLHDRFGETEGWEPSWALATDQADHVRRAHEVQIAVDPPRTTKRPAEAGRPSHREPF